MELLTNEELFDILDGTAPAEVRQRHQQWMAADENYRQYFTELRELHEGLALLPLESPSMAFENKLMSKWEMASTGYKVPTILTLLPFLFAVLMGLLLIITFAFLGMQPTAENAPGNGFDVIMKNIDPKLVKHIVLPINCLLLLLIFERILRNRWKRDWEQA